MKSAKILIVFSMMQAWQVATAADDLSLVQQIRKQFVNTCVSRAIDRRDDAAEAAKFCSCSFDVMARELTLQEYIDMDDASHKGRPINSVPALARLRPKLEVCRK